MNPAVLPPLDAIPAPAPVWLLKGLLWVTFAIHLVLMNLTLGGSLLCAVYAFRGQEKHRSVAKALAKALPFTMPFTISFGVAPLLFIQVLYGPLFYTASILMATPFLAIIGVVIVAYYLMYLLGWKWSSLGRSQGWVAAAICVLLGYVGFTYTHVFTLMLDPSRFRDLYLASPGGLSTHFADPTVFPRFLHMAFGAIAVTGLFVAFLGTRRLRLDPEVGRWQFKNGVTWFAAATVVNMGLGAWWLLALTQREMLLFMGGNALATGAFVVGLICALSALVVALMAVNSVKPVPMLMGSVHALAATIVCMVLMRDALRDALLKPVYDVWALPVAPQWGAIALFLVLFVLGIVACVWMLRMLRKAAKERAARGDEGNRGPGLTDSGLHRISLSDSQALRGGLEPEVQPRRQN